MKYVVTYDALSPNGHGPSRATRVMDGSIDEILLQLQRSHGKHNLSTGETKLAVIHLINSERVVKDLS